MDRAGGYASYRMLLLDARAYDDVLIVLQAEAEAARIEAMKARAGR